MPPVDRVNPLQTLTSIAHALAMVDGERMSNKQLEMPAQSNKKFVEEFGKPEHIKSMYT
ncbi:uncharacterized protein BJX67DRAFT_352744 [Aspergillus lucknowensis]|uniref:Uncharacterized protein n=1 Tax=Aspergillus lucknowensis TaxID=176173 RepID=A0ABR4LSW7_9EURO